MHDLEQIRANNSISSEALRWGIRLEADGNEFVACCPFHQDKTASFTIFRGRKDGLERFHCFGCGEGGDVIDFVRKGKGVETGEAIRILAGDDDRPTLAPREIVKPRNVYEGITPIEPPAASIFAGRKIALYNPKRADTETEGLGSMSPSAAYQYRLQDGSLFGYVLRRDMVGGKKETPMVMYVRLPDGRECWSRFPFPTPRPLYGLHDLKDSDRQVVVVEGEKCRDAMRKTTGRCVLAWPGGTYGVEHTDWSPLIGRDVFIWPDIDEPGSDTADNIAQKIIDVGGIPRVLSIFGYSQ